MFNQLEDISKPPLVEEAPGDPVLHQYLTDRDTPCPSCNYNLRDLANGHCPECGEAITLHLRTSGPFARSGTLVLLVFLWLLAASGVQGYLAGRSIHETATNPFAQLFTSITINGSVSISRNLTRQLISPVIQLMQSPAIKETPDVVADSSTPAVTPNWTITTPQTQWSYLRGNSSSYNFAQVSWQQWTSGGVWTGLFTAAVIGLILLLIIRRRNEATPAMSRSVFILAWSGFGVFCAMHLISTITGLI